MANQEALSAVRHRYVNDLNLVHALISMAERRLDDEHGKDVFRTTRARIRTIALAHRHAWASVPEGTVTGVAVQQFFASIIGDVREQTHRDGEIEVIQRIDPVVVDFDKAVALGLALRELVDNAIRHGLAGEAGRVTVGLTRYGSELLLWVEDDGRRSRPDRSAWRGQGLGLAVVDLLAEQLGSELVTKTADIGGTHVELRVPLSEVSA